MIMDNSLQFLLLRVDRLDMSCTKHEPHKLLEQLQ